MKRKCSAKNATSGKLPFKSEREIKTFPEKKKSLESLLPLDLPFKKCSRDSCKGKIKAH